jgi:nucleotide-binding universal stress UspA family protein
MYSASRAAIKEFCSRNRQGAELPPTIPCQLKDPAHAGATATPAWPALLSSGFRPYTAAVEPTGEGLFELGTDGPKAILVGVDDSTTSTRAAWYAAGLARRQGASITAVYVGPIASLSAAVHGGAELAAVQHQAFEETAADMRRRADEVSQELGISVTFIATNGDPFTELRRIADEIRADAVVVGASAHAGHRLIGSLAVRLVRAGKWPVTVVP